jgi:hypothetical protein
MPSVNPSPLFSARGLHETKKDLELRITVRWSAAKLDRELARGVDPDSSDELGLRAAQLSSPEKRTQFARSIKGLLRLVDGWSGAQLPMPRSPVATQRVAANRAPLLNLRARVLAEGPLSPRGLALVSLLLEDARSPVYSHELSANELQPAIRTALEALEAETPTRASGPSTAVR